MATPFDPRYVVAPEVEGVQTFPNPERLRRQVPLRLALPGPRFPGRR